MASPDVTISVLLPVRDGARTLACAIESIRRQTFAPWEIVVLDDGSQDRTVEIAESFNDPRIRVLQDGRKLGLAARLNQGIDLARGRYLVRMDADDVAYPERFARQVDFLERHGEIDLLGTRALIFAAGGEAAALFPYRATHAEICARPWNGFYLPHPTWMGRKGWFSRFRYRTPEVVRAEDQDLLLRAYDTSQFACLPEVLLGYRVAPTTLASLLTARLSLARAQFVTHWSKRRPLFAFLGAATFLAKGLVDTLHFLLGGETALRYKPGVVPDAEKSRWVAVWRSVAGKTGMGHGVQ